MKKGDRANFKYYNGEMDAIIEKLNAMEKERMESPELVHGAYTYGELKKAFDAVCDPTDWKAPIMAAMPGEAVNIVVAAIEFFTATNPKVGVAVGTMRYVVTSEGYRAGPAGDH